MMRAYYFEGKEPIKSSSLLDLWLIKDSPSSASAEKQITGQAREV
jgi:hypothetical protein